MQAKDREGIESRGSGRRNPALPSAYLRTCLQLLLVEGSGAHGYDLAERAAGLGIDGADRGGVYRLLRSMEDEGLVVSEWSDGDGGPKRRVYGITDEGVEQLRRSTDTLRETLGHIAGFIGRYEALDQPRRGIAA